MAYYHYYEDFDSEEEDIVTVGFKLGKEIYMYLGLDEGINQCDSDNLATAIDDVQFSHFWHDNEDSIPDEEEDLHYKTLNTLQNMAKIGNFEEKPKRKRYYPQVGEPTLREEREGTEEASAEDEGLTVKKVLVCALAVLLVVSTGVVTLAFAGAAVLFLPMLGGLAKE